jgi:hypothetical protein
LLEQPKVLEYAADHLTQLRHLPTRQFVDMKLRHPDVAGGRILRAQQQPHERRFARTGRADQEDELTLVDLDVDVVQRRTSRRLVLLADMVQGDHHGTPV